MGNRVPHAGSHASSCGPQRSLTARPPDHRRRRRGSRRPDRHLHRPCGRLDAPPPRDAGRPARTDLARAGRRRARAAARWPSQHGAAPHEFRACSRPGPGAGRAAGRRLGWIVTAGASFQALGTTAAVVVTCPSLLVDARNLLEHDLAEIDLACSRFREDSELSRVNRAQGLRVEIGDTFHAALEVGLRAAEQTDGLVDPTLGAELRMAGYDRTFELVRTRAGWHVTRCSPVRRRWHEVELSDDPPAVRVPRGVELDLGATAKALAADRAAARIARELRTGVLVSLGGDVAVAGRAPEGGWCILISTTSTTPASTSAVLGRDRRRRAGDVEHDGPPLADRRRRARTTSSIRAPVPRPQRRGGRSPSPRPRASTRTSRRRPRSCSATGPRRGSHAAGCRRGSCATTGAVRHGLRLARRARGDRMLSSRARGRSGTSPGAPASSRCCCSRRRSPSASASPSLAEPQLAALRSSPAPTAT